MYSYYTRKNLCVIHSFLSFRIHLDNQFACFIDDFVYIKFIKYFCSQISIDLNISTGRSVSDPAAIPTLVREDGSFHSSWESRSLDTEENGYEHAAEEDLYREFEAQLTRFRELTGREPDYIHGHAYTTPRILRIEQELADARGIPYTSSVWKQIAGVSLPEYRMGWYKKPATLENQRDWFEEASQLSVG